MDSSQLFGLSNVAYVVAMIFYITYLVARKPGIGVAATIVTITGFVLQTLAFIIRTKEFYDLGQMGILRAIPLTNLYESLIFC